MQVAVLWAWVAYEMVRGSLRGAVCPLSTCHTLCQALGIQGELVRDPKHPPTTPPKDLVATHMSCQAL